MIAINQTNKIITKKIEVEIIETIFHWYSTYEWKHADKSPHCHCLLRIYWLDNKSKAVIIASELYSNEDNTDIWTSYSELVTEIIKQFSQLKEIIDNITWLTHSGQFSVPFSWAESHQKDCFRKFSVQLNKEEQKIKIDELEIIKDEEVIKLLNGASLEPTVEILQQLQHDNGWGGVVDENQVKGCLELAEGIILGQKRTAGLIGW